jgi:hypothetical protein
MWKKTPPKFPLGSLDVNVRKSQSFATTWINHYPGSKTTLSNAWKACAIELLTFCNKWFSKNSYIQVEIVLGQILIALSKVLANISLANRGKKILLYLMSFSLFCNYVYHLRHFENLWWNQSGYVVNFSFDIPY